MFEQFYESHRYYHNNSPRYDYQDGPSTNDRRGLLCYHSQVRKYQQFQHTYGLQIGPYIQQAEIQLCSTLLRLVLFAPVWSSLVNFDHVWSSLVKFSKVWSCLVKFGQDWSSLVKFGQV